MSGSIVSGHQKMSYEAAVANAVHRLVNFGHMMFSDQSPDRPLAGVTLVVSKQMRQAIKKSLSANGNYGSIPVLVDESRTGFSWELVKRLDV